MAFDTPWCGSTTDKLYLQSGQFESTLKTSEDVSGIDDAVLGISWDGTNTPWCGSTADKLYLQSGQFESTLKTSEDVSGIDTIVSDISWDGTNTPWCGSTPDKLYLQSGQFESTLKTSEDVSGVDTNVRGISTNNLWDRLGHPPILLTEPLSITTSLAANIEIGVPSAELSITTSLAAGLYQGALVTLTEPLAITTSLAADLLLSLPARIEVVTSIISNPTIIIPNPKIYITTSLSAEVSTFSIAYSNKVYIFTLTGSANGVADIEIPISSFSSRMQQGDPTYLSVVIPGVEYLSEINNRLNGDLIITMGYKRGGVLLLAEKIITVDFENMQYNEGAQNKSITLDGHRTETFIPKTVTLQGVSYKNITKGVLRFRCIPDLYLHPGDTAEYGTDSYTVSSISFSVSAGQETYEVVE